MNDFRHIRPLSFASDERQAIAMREATENVVVESPSQQHFSAIHLNRDFHPNPTVVVHGPWLSTVLKADMKYVGYQYAAVLPENPIIVIDPAGHGLSDNLPPEQWHEVHRQKQFSGMAQAQAEAIAHSIPDVKDVILSSGSLGARVAPDFAIQAGRIGLKPLLMVGFEMIGLESRPSLGMAWSFLIKENVIKNNRDYRKNPIYRQLNETFEVDFKNEIAEYGYVDPGIKNTDAYRRDPALFWCNFQGSPLAAATGAVALEQALEEQPDMKTELVIGSQSTMCRLDRIEPLLRQLRKQFPGRLDYEIWPKDSHGMTLAPQAPRLAAATVIKIAEHLGR